VGLTKVRGGGVDNPLTLGGGSASDNSIVFDGNAQDFHIGLDDSTDSLTMGLGSSLGTTSHIVTDSSGRVEKPLQPYFLAKPSSSSSGDGNTANPFKFQNVIHNVGNHFVTSGTGAHERFVAPITARYIFSTAPGYLQTSTNFNFRLRINGSNFAELGRFIQGSAASHCLFTGSIIIQLSANDYVDIINNYTPYHLNATYNFFCGYLLG